MSYQVDVLGEELRQLRYRLRRLPLDRQLQREKRNLTWLRQELMKGTLRQSQQAIHHCQTLRQKLANLDPQAVLRRGYAIVRQADETIIRSTADLTLGQELQIKLGQGQLKVQVTEILPTTLDASESLP